MVLIKNRIKNIPLNLQLKRHNRKGMIIKKTTVNTCNGKKNLVVCTVRTKNKVTMPEKEKISLYYDK